MSTPGSTPTSGSPRVHGVCTVMFAFDIGYGIDLRAAAQRVGGELGANIAGSPPTPRHGGAAPRPLRVRRDAPATDVLEGNSAWRTNAGAHVSIWDFGGVSVALRIDLDAPLDRLVDLSCALYGNSRLLGAARGVVDDLLRALGDTVANPKVSALIEDYAVFELACPGEVERADSLVSTAGGVLARVLRAEAGALSDEETGEALAARVSYSPGDLTIIDWNAAFMIGAGTAAPQEDDELAVLEYANVELLEMRVLDDRLDAALDTAFAAAHRGRWWAEAAELSTVANLQVEAALLFEAVNNAAKLIGDQYLSRLYRAAATRLHLAEWDTTILRKLQTLESLYEKLNDRRANRRMEILEWIIIVLIAFEIVWSLIPRGVW